MKVKDLLALLAQADQELEVAVQRDEDHEYWGKIYGRAEFAGPAREPIDGPMSNDQPCFLITT